MAPQVNFSDHSTMLLIDTENDCYEDNQLVQPLKETRRVRFSANLERIREIPSKKDMTYGEIDALWMTEDDWLLLEDSIQDDLLNLTKCTGSEAKRNMRGLEWRITQLKQWQLQNRKKGYEWVFEEQLRQRNSNQSDPERIALLYKNLTKNCQRRAAYIGKMDHAEALRISNEYDTQAAHEPTTQIIHQGQRSMITCQNPVSMTTSSENSLAPCTSISVL